MPFSTPRTKATNLSVAATLALTAFSAYTFARDFTTKPPAPDFSHSRAEAWVNSGPLSLADLRGQVVLIDVWTFDCWNCYRSFPWLNALEQKLSGRNFRVVSVHTPEFEHERVRANVERKTAEFSLVHPIMIDNDYSYWNALGNRYWPTYYLIDKQGRLRKRFIGETRADSERATTIERAIEALLSE